MSDTTITLALETREVFGKAVKTLRRNGKVPAVIHDHGKESVHVMAPFIDMTKVYQQAGKHHPVNLTIDGKKYLALIRDADFEPKKHQLRHLVFNAINQNQTVEAEVPVILEGEIPAEKISLLVLKQLETVEVEGLPKDLVDELTVDASSLAEAGDKLTVADIKVPAGLTITTDPETVIATVEVPKDQLADAEAAAAEQAEADGKIEEVVAEGGETPEATTEETKE